MKQTWFKKSYLTAVYIFLYLPIAVTILFSFNNAERSLVWHGFTLNWYHQLFRDHDLAIVTLHSLEIGVIASTVATLMGLIAAVSLYRYQFLGKRFLNLLILILIIIPDLVLGVSLLLLYSMLHFTLGFWTLLLSHISFCLPFACVTISGRMITFDKHLIEASKDLGSSEWMLYSKILIPLLLPGIVAAWLLCFTLSIDDVVISYFVSGPSYQILPLQIFSMVKLGVKPEVSALSSVLFVITFILAISSQMLLKEEE